MNFSSTQDQEFNTQPRREHTALILGATGGIGFAFAESLASLGFRMILSGRNTGRLEKQAVELRDRFRVSIELMEADLCKEKDLQRLLQILEDDRQIDWLINAAGIANWGLFRENRLEDEETLLQVNLKAPMMLTHQAIRSFLKRGGGTIVHVSSMSSLMDLPYLSNYCASKSGLTRLVMSIHEELRGEPIRLQALCPGFVRTEIFSRAGADASKLPSWIWLEPDQVVRESLRSLKRDRGICIPGLRYRLLAFFLTHFGGTISRRITGWLFGNFKTLRLDSPPRSVVSKS